MLPKRLSKKELKPSDSTQLKLEQTIPTKEKIKKKRSFLLIVLALTVGLSIIFSLYRTITNISVLPKFSLPSFKSKNTTTFTTKISHINLDKPVKAILSQPNNWSIYVKTLNPPSSSWSHNFPLPLSDSIISDLLAQKPSLDNLIKNSIPQGSQVKENIISQDDSLEYQAIISVPQQQILIIIKTKQDSTTDYLINQLIQIIYWQVILI